MLSAPALVAAASAVAVGICLPLTHRGDEPRPDPRSTLALQSDSPEAAALRRAAATTPHPYSSIELPAHFRSIGAERFDDQPASNPVTDAGATLGRFLFYDTRLSRNGTASCASCHDQAHGFSDPNPRSRGFDGRLTDRKAMNLVNLRYNGRGRFFWDERAEGLEAAVLDPIENEVELGHSLDVLVAEIATDSSYRPHFEAAFGSPEVDRDRIARSLAQFLRSIVSYRSRYDEGLAKVADVRADFPNFSALENQGKQVFVSVCARCHMRLGQEAHFAVIDPLNNGLDASIDMPDGGVGDITLEPRDLGKFKSPQLRNVEVTGPYMHDGRFHSLDEVVEHYSSGVALHPNLSGEGLRRFHFDERQKQALVAFMKTLTDPLFLTAKEYSNPYVVTSGEATTLASVDLPNPRVAIVEWLARFDEDHDGALARRELEGLHPALEREGLTRGRRGGFRRARDGGFDQDAISNLAAHIWTTLATLDRNADARVDAAELEGAARLLSLGDDDGNGALDAFEVSALAERFLNESIPSDLQPIFSRAAIEASSPTARLQPQPTGATSEQVVTEVIDSVAALPASQGLNGERVYRAIAAIGVTEPQQRAVSDLLAEHRVALREDGAQRRATYIGELRGILGEEWYRRFEEAAIRNQARGGGLGFVAGSTASPADVAEALLEMFDFDENGALDHAEQRQLGTRLASIPGGFSFGLIEFSAPSGASLRAMVNRILEHDVDGDLRVSPEELPERMRRGLFGPLALGQDVTLGSAEIEARMSTQVLREFRGEEARLPGFQVTGGAGGGTLSLDRVQRVLDEIGPPEELRARVVEVTRSYEDPERSLRNRQRLVQELAEILGTEQFRRFREHVLTQDFVPARRPLRGR